MKEARQERHILYVPLTKKCPEEVSLKKQKVDEWLAGQGLGNNREGSWDRGVIVSGCPSFLFEVRKCSHIDLVLAAQLCEYAKTHLIVHFE